MAVKTINIVQENTAPPIVLNCKRDDGSIIDLTGCTVEVIIARGSTITNAGHQEATVVTPTAGQIQYDPEATDFPTPGTYKADVRVTYANATYEVLYEQQKFKVRKRLQ